MLPFTSVSAVADELPVDEGDGILSSLKLTGTATSYNYALPINEEQSNYTMYIPIISYQLL
jgi:hypothetical protein